MGSVNNGCTFLIQLNDSLKDLISALWIDGNRRLVKEAIAFVGLEDFANFYPKKFAKSSSPTNAIASLTYFLHKVLSLT